MKENTFEKPTVDAPLRVAESVLEKAGYLIVDIESDCQVVGFAIPNSFGGECGAVVEFLPGAGILQMTTALTRGQVNPLLAIGLTLLLNRLNLMMRGVTFTFDHDEEDGDEIEISIECFVLDEIQLEEHVKLMVRYLQEAVKLSLPAIYQYVAQRIRARPGHDGKLEYLGPTVTVEQALDMIELKQFGRA